MLEKKIDSKILEIAEQLAVQRQGLEYGEIAVTLKIHQKEIVCITYSRTEQTRQKQG